MFGNYYRKLCSIKFLEELMNVMLRLVLFFLFETTNTSVTVTVFLSVLCGH